MSSIVQQQQQQQQQRGWPFGLQALNVRLRLMEHLVDAASSAVFLHSTPSITSDSSSDLDTESTGSFFPEKSITLGTLIGIRSATVSNTPAVPTAALAAEFLDTDAARKRRTCNNNRHRSWCGFMGCVNSSGGSRESFSPSLAHLFELERQAGNRPAQEGIGGEDDAERRETCVEESSLETNTLFSADRILPPRPLGAPLKLILQQGSPGSSYLSGDWNSSCDHQREAFRHQHEGSNNLQNGATSASLKHLIFWPSMCGSTTSLPA